eukprot:superscaffoldBa00003112_g16152
MTWSPLACGIITGKYENGIPESSRASMKSYQWLKEKIVSEDGRKQQAKLKELNHIAEKLGCTLPQLAVAWCLRNEGVSSVLLGTSNPEQLTENLGAIQHIIKTTKKRFDQTSSSCKAEHHGTCVSGIETLSGERVKHVAPRVVFEELLLRFTR